ncbi:MAG: nucleotidyltransferase domain-containing protein [Herpetosiphonaceae bacterium]|nr:nucleotidyltransferase domain-containing protein [Herpetosiphonaceae bacterium]
MATVTLRTIDDALITEVRDRIVKAYNPDAIMLFGSAARHQQRPGSDLDLLVIMKLAEGETLRDKARAIHALFDGWLLPLDIIVLTPEGWTRGLQLPGHIARIVASEGVRLYG